MSSCMGETNNYEGQVYEYQPIFGTGAAVVGLTPSQENSKQLEFDEQSPDIFEGDKDVLGEVEFPDRQAMMKTDI